jgi:single-strand selective monofunctional uracil DNA glycosylase
MAQTGVPFGEVNAVRGWLGIRGAVSKPEAEHPKRPVAGFGCPRCEISGQRLWGLFAERFGQAVHFFSEHIVLNYCPLVFMERTGRNRTPDKLPPDEKVKLFRACDEHLRAAIRTLEPEWLVGIGEFAFARAQQALTGGGLNLMKIAHPSPASPAANRDWKGLATRQLQDAGVWR